MKDNIVRLMHPADHVDSSELSEMAAIAKQNVLLLCVYDETSGGKSWLVTIGGSWNGVGSTPREALDRAVFAYGATD